jgi:RNA polymerase sigma factor (sigma-70 family)
MSEPAATGSARPGVPRAVVSDDRLARSATKGDRRALAAIYRRYHQDLYRFCLAIVGNSQDAQDALQNTMVKVLGALPGEKREIRLKPWLYRIAHNESIDVVRRRRAVEELGPDQAAGGPGLAEEAVLRERLRRLLSDVDELPERQRAALLMRELAGLGFREIAAALGTSPATARQTLYEARLSLHEMEEGREMSCDAVTRALSDADGRVTRRRDIRAHVRSCRSCSRFGEEIESRRHDLAGIAPLPFAAATGLLHGILGGGTAKAALGTTAALKAATAVAVVAVVGVSADRSGLVDLGLPGGHHPATPASESAPQEPAASGAAPVSQPAGTAPGSSASRKPATAGRSDAKKGNVAAGTATATGGGAGGAAPAATSPPPGQAVEHPHGRGHAKQHPAAAAHGQETAAAHKHGNHSGGQGKPEHQTRPVKPAQPAHPAHPSQPPQQSSPPEHPSPPGGTGGGRDSTTPAQSHGSTGQAQPQAPQASAEPVPPAPVGETSP